MSEKHLDPNRVCVCQCHANGWEDCGECCHGANQQALFDARSQLSVERVRAEAAERTYKEWARAFGSALTLYLQGDRSEVDMLSTTCSVGIDDDGAPILRSLAPASAKPAAPGSLTEYLKMSDKEKVALLKGKPAPRSSPVCSCRVDALEPNPYCPIHGGERKPAAEKESNDLCGGHGGTMDATPAPAAEKCKHDGGFEDAFGPGLPTGICHLVCTRCGKSAVAIERETRPAPAKGEKA